MRNLTFCRCAPDDLNILLKVSASIATLRLRNCVRPTKCVAMLRYPSPKVRTGSMGQWWPPFDGVSTKRDQRMLATEVGQ